MGVMIHSGVLTEEKKLTEHAKKKFIQDVLDIIEHGSEGLPNKPLFQCGDPIPANPIKNALPNLFDEKIYPDFHKNTLGLYEKIAVALDLESNFSLLPVAADPIAIAGKFGVELPQLKFPEGFIPYVTGMLIPKLAIDLVAAGKTEFLLPIKLAQKLPSLIGIPTPPKFDPPQLTLPPPLFNVPNVPVDLLVNEDIQPEQPIVKLNISPPQVPNIPNEVLKELFSVNLSVVESIPKLVGDLIAKIPEIASKLPDIMVVVGDICKLIRDSNVFGKSEPTSTIQHAVNFVLARKTAECVLGGVIATTIGSSPGSIAPTVVSTVSGAKPGPGNHDAHTTQPQPPPTPPATPPADPVDWMISAAASMEGTSYGDPRTRTQYLNGLFYAEVSMALNTSTAKRNIFGNLAKDINSTLKTAGLHEKTDIVGVKDEILESIPIARGQAFYDASGTDARGQSSCGMFLRACYAASTIPNEFFLRQYVPGSAISTFKHIGIMRNYWWTAHKTPQGKKPLLSYFLNSDGKINLDKYNHFINTRPITLDDGTVQQQPNVQIDKLLADYNGNIMYPEDNVAPGLRQALIDAKKEPAHLAVITGNQLAKLVNDAGDNFPALEPGDGLLLMRVIHPLPPAEPYLAEGGEHALFITSSRPKGWANKIPGDNNIDLNDQRRADLVDPVKAIEGGYLDGRNRPDYDENSAAGKFADELIKPETDAQRATAAAFALAQEQAIYARNMQIDKASWFNDNGLQRSLNEQNAAAGDGNSQGQTNSSDDDAGATSTAYSPPPLDPVANEKLIKDEFVAKQVAADKAEKTKPRATAIAEVVYDRGLQNLKLGTAPSRRSYFTIGQSTVKDTEGNLYVGLEGGTNAGVEANIGSGSGNQFAIIAIYKARGYISEIPYLAKTPEGREDAFIAAIIMDKHPEIFNFGPSTRGMRLKMIQYYAFPKLSQNLTDAALRIENQKKMDAKIKGTGK